MKPALSIVMPVLNEAAGLPAALQALAALRQRGVQLVVVDGGSTDATMALALAATGPCGSDSAKSAVDATITAPRGRASQMNAGARMAGADALLFLHADTQLPPDADVAVLGALNAGADWGRFDVRISGRPLMLRVVAALMNVRSRATGIATGDQALFVRRKVFDAVQGFPDQPLMEDIELSRRLRRLSPPACLRARVTTSGRRWEQHGVWRTIWLMWRLRWRYWRGEPASTLARAYR